MLKKISDSTASSPLGYPAGTKLFKIESGEFAGRQVALMHTSAAEISLRYADTPYTSWSTPVVVASDAANSPFDAVMNDDGDLHIVYSENGTNVLVTRTIAFSGGSWTAGSKVTIYNVDPSLRPCVIYDHLGTLWAAWTRQNGGLEYINVKSSTDNGATWGSGVTDGGAVITPGTAAAHVRLLIRESALYAVYVTGTSKIAIASRALPSGSWGLETTISAVIPLDQHFDAAVSNDGAIGVVYDHGQLKFREFDGSSWGAIATLDASGGSFPQIRYVGNVPLIYYLSSVGSDQVQIKYTERRSGSFSTPQNLDSRFRAFDKLFLYSSTTTVFQNLTTEAGNATTADILHADSGRIVSAVGDKLFLGMDVKFRYLKWLLSTAGSGGSVAYSYWNGSDWQSFTPAGGAFNLDASDKEYLLWTDFASVPDDWQKNSVNGENLFWIKVEVVSAFTTGPIGSQITSISDITALSVRR
jgi:hypothetical protein